MPLAIVHLASPQPASATESWPQTLDDVLAIDVAAHPDGSVSVFSCGNGSNSAQTFSSAGSILTTVDDQANVFCDGWESVAGPDGAIYATKYSSGGQVDIVAFQDDDELWTPVELTACTNEWAWSAGMVIGADGDLYVLAYSPNCSNQNYLLGIEADTGVTKFKEPLGSAATYPSNRNGYVAAYDGGLIVRHGNSTFRYFDYAGDEDTGKEHTVSLAGSESIGRWAVNTDGTLFAMVHDTDWYRSGECTESHILNRVFRRTLAGSNHDYELDDACTYADNIRVTPTGGAVVPIPAGNQVGGSYDPDTSLLLLQSNGNIVGITVPPPAGFTLMSGGSATTPLLVDTAGNLVLTRRLYDIGSGDGDRYVQVALLNPGGALMASYNTFVNGNPTGWNNHNAAEGGTGIVNGSVYLAYCIYSTCNFAGAYELHKLSFAEVGFEYPMGALLDLPAPQPTLNLVVLGDSFSSGEGVPSFISPSDTNGCHRSEMAYARVLDQDPSVPLYLQAFVACSGATTTNVIQGMNTESSQLDAITAATDVIVISIGGNDVLFEDYVVECLFFTCDAGGSAYQDTSDKIDYDLQDDLEYLFTVIRGKLTQLENTDAQILVIGYPQLSPLNDEQTTWPWCGWIDTDNEYIAMRDIATRLNTKVQLATASAAAEDFNFEFVDPQALGSPFIGNELCDGESFFNGPTTPPWHNYSLHPNALGQQAYATLIKGEL